MLSSIPSIRSCNSELLGPPALQRYFVVCMFSELSGPPGPATSCMHACIHMWGRKEGKNKSNPCRANRNTRSAPAALIGFEELCSHTSTRKSLRKHCRPGYGLSLGAGGGGQPQGDREMTIRRSIDVPLEALLVDGYDYQPPHTSTRISHLTPTSQSNVGTSVLFITRRKSIRRGPWRILQEGLMISYLIDLYSGQDEIVNSDRR